MDFEYENPDASSCPLPLLRRTWAEIDLDALEHNLTVLKKRSDSKFLAVVKADAYGHGAIQTAKLMEKAGADYLAVSNIEEGIEIRKAGVTMPILILGHTPPECVPYLIKWDIEQACASPEAGIEFSEAVKAYRATGHEDAVLKIHIKLDTGMTRIGFICTGGRDDRAVEQIKETCALPGLEHIGVFTHFSVSDEPGNEEDIKYTKDQLALFSRMISKLEACGITFKVRHCANSGAVVNFSESTAFDMVRPGILLYGCGDGAKELGLIPAMKLMSAVSQVRCPDEGVSVSYGRMVTLEKPTRMGVIPIGYADGLFRTLSNKVSFMSEDGPVPQIGRICMDMCMIDLTDRPSVKEGSRIEIFGPDNPVEKLAQLAETIPYEFLCAVNKRIPRIYLRDGKIVGCEHRMYLY